MDSHTTSSEAADLTQERVDALIPPSGVGGPDVTVVPATGSTNADLLDRFAAGEASEGAVLAAGEQTAGRGRLDRTWDSPPASSLSFSVLLTPPVDRAGFVPPLTAISVAQAISGLSGLDVTLKWPNDIMIGDGKVAGILAEGVHGAVVVGCGINVSIAEEDLPVPTATSIQLQGPLLDRAALLVACLGEIDAAYGRWRDAGFSAQASGLLAAYRSACATIGRQVRVGLPDGTELHGRATGIDDLGRLTIDTDEGPRTLTAGDVVHVRSQN